MARLHPEAGATLAGQIAHHVVVVPVVHVLSGASNCRGSLDDVGLGNGGWNGHQVGLIDGVQQAVVGDAFFIVEGYVGACGGVVGDREAAIDGVGCGALLKGSGNRCGMRGDGQGREAYEAAGEEHLVLSMLKD